MSRMHSNSGYMYVNPLFKQLVNLYAQLFGKETKSTRKKLIATMIATYYLNACDSVRAMFNNFLKNQGLGGLTSFYYTLNEGKLFTEEWKFNLINIILVKADIKIDSLLFTVTDDTLVEKFGDKFELVSILHDHNAKNGSNYLKGHCFVSLLLMIPITKNGKSFYVPIPVAHKMWDKDSGVSKIKLAADMALDVYEHLKDKFQVAFMCDSWYTKKEVLDLHKNYNMPMICASRHDTALYMMPTAPQPGKRGPKPIRGEKLSKDLDEVFDFSEIEGYNFLIGYKLVMTDIFGRTPCVAYATKSKSDGKINLFIATNNLDLSRFDLNLITNKQMKSLVAANDIYLAFAMYKFRWSIETMYYQLKSFWGFCDYKLRSYCGIQNLINIQTLAYAVTTIMPYIIDDFACLEPLSVQERRFQIGDLIQRLINFDSFVTSLEKGDNSAALIANCERYMADQKLAV